MKNMVIYDIKNTGFEVANNIKNTKLKGNEYRIYHYLALGADKETGECMRLLGTISAETGLHKDTVRRVIKKLIAKGLILMQMRKNQYNNENASNIYTICAMLSDIALATKKAYIEEYPVIKIGVDVVEDLVAKTIEKMSSQNEESEEVNEEVPQGTETNETEEVVVEEEVVEESPYERFKRIKREEMLLEKQEKDKELVMLGRKYGFDLTLEQARNLNNHYIFSRIEIAMTKANIVNKTTYYYLNDMLRKQEEERVNKYIELHPFFNNCNNIAE